MDHEIYFTKSWEFDSKRVRQLDVLIRGKESGNCHVKESDCFPPPPANHTHSGSICPTFFASTNHHYGALEWEHHWLISCLISIEPELLRKDILDSLDEPLPRTGFSCNIV